QNAETREKIIPVVDDVFRVADRQQGQGRSARVSHVRCDGEELFEKEKRAKGGAGDVPLKRKINDQSEGRKELQECATDDGYPLAKEAEEKMTTFVNGNENEVDHQKRALAAKSLVKKQKIKNQPRDEGPSRDRLPVVFERIEEREAVRERFGDLHCRLWYADTCRR